MKKSVNVEKVLSLLQINHEKYLKSFVSRGKLNEKYYQLMVKYGKVKLEEDKEINKWYIKNFFNFLEEKSIFLERKRAIREDIIFNKNDIDLVCNIYAMDETEMFVESDEGRKSLNINNLDEQTMAKMLTFENPFLINNCNDYHFNGKVLFDVMQENGMYERWYKGLPSLIKFCRDEENYNVEEWIKEEFKKLNGTTKKESKKILKELLELAKTDKNLSGYGQYWNSLFEEAIRKQSLGFLKIDTPVVNCFRQLHFTANKKDLSLENEDWSYINFFNSKREMSLESFMNGLQRENPKLDKFSENYFLVMLLFCEQYKSHKDLMVIKENLNVITQNDIEIQNGFDYCEKFLNIENIRKTIDRFLDTNKDAYKKFEKEIAKLFQLLEVKYLEENDLKEINPIVKKNLVVSLDTKSFEKYVDITYFGQAWINSFNEITKTIKIWPANIENREVTAINLMFEDTYLNENNYKETFNLVFKELIKIIENIPPGYGSILDGKIKESILKERLKEHAGSEEKTRAKKKI